MRLRIKMEHETGNRKENRSGKQKIRNIISICCVLMTAAVCLTGLTVRAYSASQNDGEDAAISAGKNEELAEGTITAVVGNEITCVLSDAGEEKNYRIPVGTEVTTKLGTVTTFSRLKAGDRVTLLLEKGTDTINKVWITR